MLRLSMRSSYMLDAEGKYDSGHHFACSLDLGDHDDEASRLSEAPQVSTFLFVHRRDYADV